MVRSVFGVVLVALVLLPLRDISAQAPPAPKKPAASAVAQPSAPKTTATAPARPLWNELTAPQKQALTPLESHWDDLSASQKRKWIALSRNYDKLPASEQVLLQARMDDWVALSPNQRRAARLNFAETKRMSSDEKQRKWQAYQALTPDARHKLNEVAPAPPPGAAVAVRPVPRQKLANVPVTDPNDPATRPKLATPNQIDPHTLLPQRRPTPPAGDRPGR